jgi:uncharacterized membrane protein
MNEVLEQLDAINRTQHDAAHRHDEDGRSHEDWDELNDEEYDARIDEIIEDIEDLDSLVSEEARELIEELRPISISEDVYEDMEEDASFAQRMADHIAVLAGSWTFIIGFMLMMGLWMGVNLYLGVNAFDRFPFILLNLALSTLAALQAPVILMSQNRQAEKDRAMAQNDYQVNLKSELEIADLHRKVDELTQLMTAQARMMNALVNTRRQETESRRRDTRRELETAGYS